MLAAFVINRIFGLCNTSLVVFPDDGGFALEMTEFLEELAVIKYGSRCMECSDVFRLG